MPMHIRETKLTSIALLVLVLGGALFLYWPALSGPFLFDDFHNLENLNQIRGTLTWGRLGQYLAAFHGDPGRPLAALSFLINDTAWPSDPWAFKYTNLLLHATNGLLVYLLARTLARPEDGDNPNDLTATYVGLAAAAIWLIHPIQISTIFQVVQRMTVMSAGFVLAGLCSYTWLLRKATSTTYALAAVFALGLFSALAFLCKENGALAPLYAWVLNSTLLRSTIQRKPKAVQKLATHSVQVAAVAPFIAFFLNAGSWLDYSFRPFTLQQRLLTEPRVICDYLRQIVAPTLSGSGSLFHDDFLLSTGLVSPPSTLPALCLVLTLLVGAITLRKRSPHLSFAVLFFLAGHSIESTFVSLELYFEHRNYLPIFGFAFVIAYWTIHSKPQRRGIFLAAFGCYLSLCAFITHQQSFIWGSERLLATVWAVEHPLSERAQELRAKVFYTDGNLDGARSVFVDAQRARPQRSNNAPLYLIYIDCQKDRAVSAASVQDARAYLKTALANPGTIDLMRRLANQATTKQCSGFTPQEWLSLTDDMLQNHRFYRQDDIYLQRSQMFRVQRNFAATVQELERAFSLAPSPTTATMLAITYATGGRYGEAIRWAETADQMPFSPVKSFLTQRHRNSKELLRALREEQRESAAGN